MSGIAVVDASALAALIFLEPNASVARDRLATIDQRKDAPRLFQEKAPVRCQFDFPACPEE